MKYKMYEESIKLKPPLDNEDRSQSPSGTKSRNAQLKNKITQLKEKITHSYKVSDRLFFFSLSVVLFSASLYGLYVLEPTAIFGILAIFSGILLLLTFNLFSISSIKADDIKPHTSVW